MHLPRRTGLSLLIIALLFLMHVDMIVSSNAASRILLLLAPDGLTKLDTEKGILVHLSGQKTVSEHPMGVTSPIGSSLVYWYPTHIVTKGFWVVSIGTLPVKLSMPFSADSVDDSSYDFGYARWLLGSRYVLIEAGKHIPSPNIVSGIREVSTRWLIDTTTYLATPWYWDCAEIIRFYSPEPQSASRCTLSETDLKEIPPEKYVTSGGIVDAIKGGYSVVYGKAQQSAFDPTWWFSNDLKHLAFVDFSEGILSQKTNLQSVAEESPNTLEKTNEFVSQLSWSPSGKYLVVFKQCHQLSTCIEIRDVLTNVVVWTSTSLNSSDVVYADDIAWFSDETGFFLLGHEAAEPYVWNINMNASLPIDRWTVPPDTYHMIWYQ